MHMHLHIPPVEQVNKTLSYIKQILRKIDSLNKKNLIKNNIFSKKYQKYYIFYFITNFNKKIRNKN
jgi:hypothetical protein